MNKEEYQFCLSKSGHKIHFEEMFVVFTQFIILYKIIIKNCFHLFSIIIYLFYGYESLDSYIYDLILVFELVNILEDHFMSHQHKDRKPFKFFTFSDYGGGVAIPK